MTPDSDRKNQSFNTRSVVKPFYWYVCMKYMVSCVRYSCTYQTPTTIVTVRTYSIIHTIRDSKNRSATRILLYGTYRTVPYRTVPYILVRARTVCTVLSVRPGTHRTFRVAVVSSCARRRDPVTILHVWRQQRRQQNRSKKDGIDFCCGSDMINDEIYDMNGMEWNGMECNQAKPNQTKPYYNIKANTTILLTILLLF